MALKGRFILLGWRQLIHNPLRLLAAVAGITFAVFGFVFGVLLLGGALRLLAWPFRRGRRRQMAA